MLRTYVAMPGVRAGAFSVPYIGTYAASSAMPRQCASDGMLFYVTTNRTFTFFVRRRAIHRAYVLLSLLFICSGCLLVHFAIF